MQQVALEASSSAMKMVCVYSASRLPVNCLFSGCFASFCWLGLLVPLFGRFSLISVGKNSATQCNRMLLKLPLLPCKWSVCHRPGFLIAFFLAALPLFVGFVLVPHFGRFSLFYRKELSRTV